MKIKNNGNRPIKIRGVRIEPGRVAEVVCTKKDLEFLYKVEVVVEDKIVPKIPAPVPAKPAVSEESKEVKTIHGGEKK